MLLSVRIGGTGERANGLLHGFRSRAHLTGTGNNRNPQTLFNQFKALPVLSSVYSRKQLEYSKSGEKHLMSLFVL